VNEIKGRKKIEGRTLRLIIPTYSFPYYTKEESKSKRSHYYPGILSYKGFVPLGLIAISKKRGRRKTHRGVGSRLRTKASVMLNTCKSKPFFTHEGLLFSIYSCLLLGLVSPIHCGFLCNEIEDISYIMIEINHVTTLTPPSLSLSLGARGWDLAHLLKGS